MWIRSQNLYTLIKCERLCIRKSVGRSHCIIGNECVVLGAYSTVDKALSVLDEIQRFIYHIDNLYATFQMPQDEEVEI